MSNRSWIFRDGLDYCSTCYPHENCLLRVVKKIPELLGHPSGSCFDRIAVVLFEHPVNVLSVVVNLPADLTEPEDALITP